MMERSIETIKCATHDSLPSIDDIASLPRNIMLIIHFGTDIENIRAIIGEEWKEELSDFSIGIHTNLPSITITRQLTDDEIAEHQDFFERCANDYHQLATSLIYMLAFNRNITLDPKDPYGIRAAFQKLKQSGRLNEWNYFFHGGHCAFKNEKTGQSIEASISTGEEFGALDPYFFIKYIRSSKQYHPLPLDIYDDYEDGCIILEKMLQLKKFERLLDKNDSLYNLVVSSRIRISFNPQGSGMVSNSSLPSKIRNLFRRKGK